MQILHEYFAFFFCLDDDVSKLAHVHLDYLGKHLAVVFQSSYLCLTLCQCPVTWKNSLMSPVTKAGPSICPWLKVNCLTSHEEMSL